MKILLLFLPFLLFSQVIDTVIRFSDEPREMLYIPEENELYIDFRRNNYFLVLDCSNYTVKKIIPRPPGYEGSAYGVWNWRRNKIYFGFNPRPDSIAVIDTQTDSIIKWIDYMAHWPFSLSYNSKEDKVYAARWSSVAVIDCATDSIIKLITGEPNSLSRFTLWDSVGNKVYCGSGWGYDRITVIDCKYDSIIAVIRTRVREPTATAYNSFRRKIYVAGRGNRAGVICAIGDTLIKNFEPIQTGDDRKPVWNSLEDKVYLAAGGDSNSFAVDTVNIIDCSTDLIIKKIIVRGFLENMCFVNWSNRLYFNAKRGGFNTLYVLDCSNDSIIGQIRFGRNPQDIVINPNNRRIYISDQYDSALYVIRDEITGIEELPTLETNRLLLETNPNPAKSSMRIMLSTNINPNSLIRIYDKTGRIVKTFSLTNRLSEIVWDRKDDFGRRVPQGVYFLRLEPPSSFRRRGITRKIILKE